MIVKCSAATMHHVLQSHVMHASIMVGSIRLLCFLEFIPAPVRGSGIVLDVGGLIGGTCDDT